MSVGSETYDVVIANDIFAMPIAATLKQKNPVTKIYLDLHEYHQEEMEQDADWKKFHKPLVEFLFKQYVKSADVISTVCKPIAQRYEKELHRKVEVITNAPFYRELPINPCGNVIRLIHHGACMRDREIHLMCDAVILSGSGYELTLMMVNNEPDYMTWMKDRYRMHPNIRFVDPVDIEKIPDVLNQYDIGLFLLPAINYNWENALPNKLFEYVQARLCIVVSPNTAMKQMVENYELGSVSEDYSIESFSRAIKKLDSTKIDRCKRSADKWARELSAETNIIKIQEIINHLFA